MSTFYGVNHTKAFVNVPSDKVDATDWFGKVRSTYDSYTFTAVLALNEKIYLGKLPKGAKVKGGRLVSSDLGTTGVIQVGYEYLNSADGTSDPDAFFAAVDVATAAVDSPMAGTVGGYMNELGGEAYIVLQATTATTATSGSVKVQLDYIVE